MLQIWRITVKKTLSLPICVVAILVLNLVSVPAHSQMFLQKGAATGYFTEEDFKLMEQTLEDALEQQPDGVTSDWENPKSGSSGKITIVQSYEAQGLPCKRIRAFNTAKNRSSEGEFDFCKQTDGQWKAVPTGPQ